MLEPVSVPFLSWSAAVGSFSVRYMTGGNCLRLRKRSKRCGDCEIQTYPPAFTDRSSLLLSKERFTPTGEGAGRSRSNPRSLMKSLPGSVLACALLLFGFNAADPSQPTTPDASKAQTTIFGFRDSAAQLAVESRFLAVPDTKRAEEHMRTLTQAPHVAGSPEDKATADYVAQKFREAGLETEIVEYRVWMNYPQEISVDVTAPPGVSMHGPSPEHVSADPFQNDPRITPAFNGMSPSADLEAEVVYAN